MYVRPLVCVSMCVCVCARARARAHSCLCVCGSGGRAKKKGEKTTIDKTKNKNPLKMFNYVQLFFRQKEKQSPGCVLASVTNKAGRQAEAGNQSIAQYPPDPAEFCDSSTPHITLSPPSLFQEQTAITSPCFIYRPQYAKYNRMIKIRMNVLLSCTVK